MFVGITSAWHSCRRSEYSGLVESDIPLRVPMTWDKCCGNERGGGVGAGGGAGGSGGETLGCAI